VDGASCYERTADRAAKKGYTQKPPTALPLKRIAMGEFIAVHPTTLSVLLPLLSGPVPSANSLEVPAITVILTLTGVAVHGASFYPLVGGLNRPRSPAIGGQRNRR